ncbi:MAG: hypothetical protein IT583_02485 [Verrucomicrobia bacterium]|nr:hypothetical protein [Verrucomicrobiota bacterium]
MRSFTVLIAAVLIAATGFGGVINQVGTYTNWTTSWTALTGQNDANNGLTKTQLDFVGDANNAGAYWADNGTYVFFRFRVQVGTVNSTTFRDSHFLLIDLNNYLYGSGFGTNIVGRPDFAFSWDSKSNDNTSHGLEMQVFNSGANTWNGINMADIDGSVSTKGSNDINGGGRTTDGYVQTTDQRDTTSFGMTTFIDYAISWAYLTNYTALAKGQTWNVALASIANATDHNNLGQGGDIAGGADPTSSITVGWQQAIPEPTVVGLLATSGIGLLIGRRLIDPKLRKAFFG